MDKRIVIFGALALAGVGAYIYFKPKGKKTTGVTDAGTAGTGTAGTGTTSTGTSGTGTVTTGTAGTIVNPNAPITNAQYAQNMENLAKFTQAQGLATQIVNLRTSLQQTPRMFGGNSQNYISTISQNAGIQNQIANIMIQINALGYKEVNGVATKL